MNETLRRDDAQDPTRLSTMLTLLLTVPCGAVAVLFILEIDVLTDPQPRRLIAAGAALLAPVGLLGLSWFSGRFAGPERWSSVVFGAVWFLVAVGLVALPLAARMGLVETPHQAGTSGLRDLRAPSDGDIRTAVAIAVAVALMVMMLGVFASWFGPRGNVVLAGLAVVVGLATLPVSFYVIVLSYDVPVSTGDDPLADTAQTLAFTWLVAAPVAAALAGLTLGGGGVRSRAAMPEATVSQGSDDRQPGSRRPA